MEKKVNETFLDNGRNLVVVPGEDCSGCIYKGASIPRCHKLGDVAGFCYGPLRTDNTSVIYIERK